MAQSIDENAERALRYFIKYEGGEKYEKGLENLKENGAGPTLRRQQRLILEMMLCRAVDNFLMYLSDLLSIIFRAKPETLKSNEQIRIDFALKHDSLDGLISSIADKKVNELAYQSMENLSSYVAEKLGFALFTSDNVRNDIVKVVEIRNLLVHARGIVNERFLTKIPYSSNKSGEEIELDINETFEMVSLLRKSVEEIDSRAIKKYLLTK